MCLTVLQGSVSNRWCDRSVFIVSRSKWAVGSENCSCHKIEHSRILQFARPFRSSDQRYNYPRIRIGRWCNRGKFEVESDKFRSDCQIVDACTGCALTSTNHRLQQRWWRVRAASTTAENRNLWRCLDVQSTTKNTDSTWLNNGHRGFRRA